MEKELNIAAILKEKPRVKVWSDTLGELRFDFIINEQTDAFPIVLTAKNGNDIRLTKDGRYYNDVEGVLPCIVPSKEMRDWSKFAWKKGDVLINGCGFQCIFKEWASDDYTKFNGCYSSSRDGYEDVPNADTMKFEKVDNNIAYGYIREIERKLGGALNLETLQIEKPKQEFKDGDIVYLNTKNGLQYVFAYDANKEMATSYIVAYCITLEEFTHIETQYICSDNMITKIRLATDSEKQQLFDALAKGNKAWDAEKKMLVDLPKEYKFKAFDKVLVRDTKDEYWKPNLFSNYNSENNEYMYGCISGGFDAVYSKYCIPYNDQTAHLLGTTDE